MQANLASRNDIANLIKKTDFDDKLKTLHKNFTSNKTKHLLVENEFKKLHLTKVLLLVQVTFSMMEHNFI